YEVDELEHVARSDRRLREARALEDLAIVLDDDQAGMQAQLREQPRDGQAGGHAPRLAVQRDLDVVPGCVHALDSRRSAALSERGDVVRGRGHRVARMPYAPQHRDAVRAGREDLAHAPGR